MATRITTTLIDDLDGSEAAETMVFALDGVSYAIDLNEKHAAALRENMRDYVSAARKQKQNRASTPGRQPRDESQPSSKEVRTWAHENGIKISPRGRISDSVLSQYMASK